MSALTVPQHENDSSYRAESVPEFRMAQILLVLADARVRNVSLDMEQLAVVEFLSANPFLVLESDSPISSNLQLQGFGRNSVAYASPGQRFISRRQRISGDLARMVTLGLARIAIRDQFRVLIATDDGLQMAAKLCSVYADAFRLSITAILPIVIKFSRTGMRKQLQEWLRADPILFDLIDSPTMTELSDEVSRITNPTDYT